MMQEQRTVKQCDMQCRGNIMETQQAKCDRAGEALAASWIGTRPLYCNIESAYFDLMTG